MITDPDMFIHLEDIESWQWRNFKDQGLQLVQRNDLVEKAIVDTQQMLADKYVRFLDPTYTLGGDCEIVNGMDDATLSWHNDAVEGYNLCILLYWDTMDADIGGQTRFRNIATKEVTGEFFPAKYNISIMNHCLRFEHIVTPLNYPMHRRVASFNFNINKDLVG